MDIHQAFKIGAKILAKDQCAYTTLHKSHGIEPYDWEILTSRENWSPDQARSMRNVIASIVEVSMTIAGLPAIPLPGQYVAAVIAEVVAPCNRMVACARAPDTFDATDASGIVGTHEIKPITPQQLMALVLAYSGGLGDEPAALRLPREVAEKVKQENVGKTKRVTSGGKVSEQS